MRILKNMSNDCYEETPMTTKTLVSKYCFKGLVDYYHGKENSGTQVGLVLEK